MGRKRAVIAPLSTESSEGSDVQCILPNNNEAAYTVKFTIGPGRKLWTWWSSDEHLDSPECWRDLLKANMEEALGRGALMFNNGDILDVIAGRNDRRGTKDGVRPEHNTGHYLDSVVNEAAEFLHPYRNNLMVIGTGNHEASVYKQVETDLTQRLVDKLNENRDSSLPPIHRAGYRYWVVFQGESASNLYKQKITACAYHGSGGGGEVTKGAMQHQRKMAVFNADIIVLGHIHEVWNIEGRQEVLSAAKKQAKLRRQATVQLGSYKADWRLDGAATWHMQRAGGVPKPLGGKFITFQQRTTSSPMGFRVVDPEVLDVEMENL